MRMVFLLRFNNNLFNSRIPTTRNTDQLRIATDSKFSMTTSNTFNNLMKPRENPLSDKQCSLTWLIKNSKRLTSHNWSLKSQHKLSNSLNLMMLLLRSIGDKRVLLLPSKIRDNVVPAGPSLPLVSWKDTLPQLKMFS